MHRTDSYFRRNPGGSSIRRFSFRRKPTRESIPTPTSTWTFNDESHEWQLLRGNINILFLLIVTTYKEGYDIIIIVSCCLNRIHTHIDVFASYI